VAVDFISLLRSSPSRFQPRLKAIVPPGAPASITIRVLHPIPGVETDVEPAVPEVLDYRFSRPDEADIAGWAVVGYPGPQLGSEHLSEMSTGKVGSALFGEDSVAIAAARTPLRVHAEAPAHQIAEVAAGQGGERIGLSVATADNLALSRAGSGGARLDAGNGAAGGEADGGKRVGYAHLIVLSAAASRIMRLARY
jgi:hypothetical protein